MKIHLLLARLLAVTVLTAGALHAQFNGPALTAKDTVNAPHVLTTDLAILYPTRHDTLLHTGDVVRITLYGVSDYTATNRISEEGYLTLPLVAPVPLDGLTVREAQALIARRLEEAQVFRNPSVQIEVTESIRSQITLLGDVHGVVPGLAGSRRLFDVLATAGGLQITTSHLITIDRPGLEQSIEVDLGTDPERSKYANIPIFPGDTITTARVGSYYLVGAWKAQGVYPLQSTAPFTVLQAYAQANGKYFEAKSNELHLIRTTGTTRTVTLVRMDDILKGKAPDPVLQADDILYLPSDKALAAIRSGGISTVLGLALTIFAAFRF